MSISARDPGMAIHLSSPRESRVARENRQEKLAQAIESRPELVLGWLATLSEEQQLEFGRRVLDQVTQMALEALRRRQVPLH